MKCGSWLSPMIQSERSEKTIFNPVKCPNLFVFESHWAHSPRTELRLIVKFVRGRNPVFRVRTSTTSSGRRANEVSGLSPGAFFNHFSTGWLGPPLEEVIWWNSYGLVAQTHRPVIGQGCRKVVCYDWPTLSVVKLQEKKITLGQPYKRWLQWLYTRSDY